MMRLPTLLLVALLAAVGPASCGSSQQTDNDSCPATQGANGSDPYYPEPATNGSPVGQQIPQMPHTHVTEGTKVQYEHSPPTSGCHYSLGQPHPAPIPPGVYPAHIDPEYWVHNLEHGYIVVLYNCGDGNGPSACQSDFASLRQWAAKQKPDPGLAQLDPQHAYAKVVVLPWKFDHKFAALSWDWYDPMDKLDTSELQRFYDNHVGNSPEGAGTP